MGQVNGGVWKSGRWSALGTTEIPALNRQLNRANLPEIQIDADLDPPEDDDDQDLE